jgi:hypothetical protein
MSTSSCTSNMPPNRSDDIPHHRPDLPYPQPREFGFTRVAMWTSYRDITSQPYLYILHRDRTCAVDTRCARGTRRPGLLMQETRKGSVLYMRRKKYMCQNVFISFRGCFPAEQTMQVPYFLIYIVNIRLRPCKIPISTLTLKRRMRGNTETGKANANIKQLPANTI